MGEASRPSPAEPPRRSGDPNGTGFWAGVLLLLAAAIPYPFSGSSEPLVLGLPAWLYVSAGAALAIAVLTVWRIRRGWGLAARVLGEED